MDDTKNAPVDSTHLSDDELQHFKQKLEKEYAESNQKLEELKNNYADLTGNKEDTKSSQDHHQGDVGTNETDKTTLMAAIDRENEKIEKINIALDRIETGNYGICMDTNQPIQKERLEAIPYALKSVAAKR